MPSQKSLLENNIPRHNVSAAQMKPWLWSVPLIDSQNTNNRRKNYLGHRNFYFVEGRSHKTTSPVLLKYYCEAR